MTSASKTMIEMKVDELDARLKWSALASAAGGSIPVPGISAVMDLAIMKKESDFQKKQLLIDKETMKKHEEAYGKEFAAKLKSIVSTKSHTFLTSSEDMMLLSRIAASEVVEDTAKIIPILGSIIGATVSASISFIMLKEMLKSHKEIALRCLDVIHEMDIIRNFDSF
jgi:hypothetical protein